MFTVYFENGTFIHTKLGLNICPILSPSTNPCSNPISASNQVSPCLASQIHLKFSCTVSSMTHHTCYNIIITYSIHITHTTHFTISYSLFSPNISDSQPSLPRSHHQYTLGTSSVYIPLAQPFSGTLRSRFLKRRPSVPSISESRGPRCPKSRYNLIWAA